MLISFALAHCLQVVCCPEPLSKVSASFLSIFFKVKVTASNSVDFCVVQLSQLDCHVAPVAWRRGLQLGKL